MSKFDETDASTGVKGLGFVAIFVFGMLALLADQSTAQTWYMCLDPYEWQLGSDYTFSNADVYASVAVEENSQHGEAVVNLPAEVYSGASRYTEVATACAASGIVVTSPGRDGDLFLLHVRFEVTHVDAVTPTSLAYASGAIHDLRLGFAQSSDIPHPNQFPAHAYLWYEHNVLTYADNLFPREDTVVCGFSDYLATKDVSPNGVFDFALCGYFGDTNCFNYATTGAASLGIGEWGLPFPITSSIEYTVRYRGIVQITAGHAGEDVTQENPGEVLTDYTIYTPAESAWFDNQDVDDDGLDNPEEYALSTDPDNPDSDGDGANDGDEVIAGTSPTNTLDALSIKDVNRIASPPALALSWDSVTGRIYTVHCSSNLMLNWPSGHVHQATGTGARMTYTNSNVGESPVFYRLNVKRE